MKKQTKLYQKWWFWICVVLIVCIIGGVLYFTTIKPYNLAVKEYNQVISIINEKNNYKIDILFDTRIGNRQNPIFSGKNTVGPLAFCRCDEPLFLGMSNDGFHHHLSTNGHTRSIK